MRLVKLLKQGRFAGRGRTPQRLAEGEGDPLGLVPASLANDPRGKYPRRLDVRRVVQQHQGLHWRVRPRALDRAFLARRGIEGQQAGVQESPLPERVQPRRYWFSSRSAVQCRCGKFRKLQ